MLGKQQAPQCPKQQRVHLQRYVALLTVTTDNLDCKAVLKTLPHLSHAFDALWVEGVPKLLQGSSMDEEARRQREEAQQRKQVELLVKKLTGSTLVGL